MKNFIRWLLKVTDLKFLYENKEVEEDEVEENNDHNI